MGDSGTKAFNFTVTRSGSTSSTSSVKFATANGSASAPKNFTLAVNLLTGSNTIALVATACAGPDLDSMTVT